MEEKHTHYKNSEEKNDTCKKNKRIANTVRILRILKQKKTKNEKKGTHES